MTASGYDLTQLELFATLKPKQLELLEQVHRIVAAPARQAFVRQGEFTQDFYVLLQGSVSAYRTEPGGGVSRIDTLRVGEWFGDLSALSNQPFQADLVADVPSTLVCVPDDDEARALAAGPVFRLFYDKNKDFRARIDDRFRERGLDYQIRMAPVFQDLENDAVRRLRERASFQQFERGDRIAEKGKPADAVYLVRGGAVARLDDDPSAEGRIQSYYSTNSSFGERCLADDDSRKWPGNYVALARTYVLAVTREALQETFGDSEATLRGLLRMSAMLVAEEEGVDTGVFDSSARLTPERRAAERAASQMTAEERELMVRKQSVKGGEALVIDLRRCTRCNACVESCVAVHDDGIPRLSKKGNRISGDLTLTTSCYNCAIPECMIACDHGAIRRDSQGLIRFLFDNCVGCSECMNHCPYDVIRMTPPPDAPGEADDAVERTGVLAFLARIPFMERWLGAGRDEEAGEPKKAKRSAGKAIKCDLCAGLPFEACVYNCPCSAISRVPTSEVLGPVRVVTT